MWNLKFRLKNVDNIYSHLTNKYDVVDYFYPVNHYKQGKKVHIAGIHVLEGDRKEQDKFAEDLQKNKKTLEFERNDNRIIVLIREEEHFYELLYNPALYYPRPIVIKEGYEHWNICAWDRSLLEDLLQEIRKWPKKLLEFEMQRMKQMNLKEVYFPKVAAEIPVKQKQAFDFAVQNGYYSYPRKVNLEQLAKMMKVSTSTYHEHLRRAEARLLPFFVGKQ